jgi:hypothetical protein
VVALRTYCQTTPQEILDTQILVLDNAGGIVCNSAAWEDCLNASAPKHFAGVIDYFPANTCDVCPGSVPRICDTGEMDDVLPFGGGARLPGCDMGFIADGDCLFILNVVNGGCQLHQVLIGYDSNKTNTTCYAVSDIEENYNSECVGSEMPNGPSFFDRLDGSTNLSERYVNQSIEYFNTSLIGIETLVNIYELNMYGGMYSSIPIHTNATWVDYLYWQDEVGCPVKTSCEAFGMRLKLDCPHSYKYEVDTDCSNVTRCHCPNGVCEASEACPADAAACPDAVCYQPTCDAGCGQTLIVNATDPGQCDSGSYCNGVGACVPCIASSAACTFDDECCSGNCKVAGTCQ